MLRSMKDLEGCAIRATDGDIGHVKDFYFDDGAWVVRYLIVETGGWFSSREVLISPISIGEPDWTASVLSVSITRDQVKNSPAIETDKPVSRQHEMRYLGYYGYPYYWAGDGLWGRGAYPGTVLMGLGAGGSDAAYRHAQAEDDRAEAEAWQHHDGDARLRSCKEVMTYHVEATDGGIGHVRGLLVDEQTWAIRYLIVDTSNWWLGHQVLIKPEWVQEVRWTDHTVSVNLTQQAVKDASPYDSGVPLTREHELGLRKHHGRASVRDDKVELKDARYPEVTSTAEGTARKTGDGHPQAERSGP